MGFRVHKFGGTSVGNGARIRAVADLVAAAERPTLVVSSAMASITDQLVAACDAAARYDLEAATALVDDIFSAHLTAAEELALGPESQSQLEGARLKAELEGLLKASIVAGELTPRVRDRILATGEKLAVRLLAETLTAMGIWARAVDADTFLETDDRFGQATPIRGVAERQTRNMLLPIIEAGVVPVVTGFCGRSPQGSTTTLGRGGSDFTATWLGAALGAEEVIIWTDVAGVYTADPRRVDGVRVVPQLNFREAAELSYYGAKVLNPRAIAPAAQVRTPIAVRSTFEPHRPGTIVDGRFTAGSHPVKALSAVRDHCLIALEGKGMSGVPGIAARAFAALAERDVSVTLISQSSSEASICIAVPEVAAAEAERAWKKAFRAELVRGDIEEIAVRTRVCIVAAVGLGMVHGTGVAGRLFYALGRAGVSVLAIAQGSSELNISVAVDGADVDRALGAAHDAFGLHRLDTGRGETDHMDLVILGAGNVAQAFLHSLAERRDSIEARFGLEPHVVGWADRSGAVFSAGGISSTQLESLIADKRAGMGLGHGDDGRAGMSTLALVTEASRWRLSTPVVVDLTDADHSEVFMKAFTIGMDVVTANKKPLAGDLQLFEAMRDTARARGALLKAETTVGAGLPVIDTLEHLLATGDRLVKAEGCLSGTLGFLCSALEAGTPFSQAVQHAMERGFTEPDPAADLTGADVARKALILGRWGGVLGEGAEVRRTGLVPDDWQGLPKETLLSRLKGLDDAFAQRMKAAREADATLRFVASVSASGVEVGLQTVPLDAPLGRLSGADNMVVFHTERYDERPLVVMGPGAGVPVTAMGVLSDVLRVAAERRAS
ncbi:MAG: bifunctional aspartate kinase/homoserine dehydrogenase I [Bradymonadia bacterium]